jgi:hypothetical protein
MAIFCPLLLLNKWLTYNQLLWAIRFVRGDTERWREKKKARFNKTESGSFVGVLVMYKPK